VAAVFQNRFFVVLLAVVLGGSASWLTGVALERQPAAVAAPSAPSPCRLAHGVQHVVYLQFDNLHLSRDVSSVPSDLEQMPRLQGFLEENGTLLGNAHGALIPNGGGDAISSLTGLYPDHHGQPVGDGWRYLDPDVSSAGAGSSLYWTSRISDGRSGSVANSGFNLVSSGGRNVPAPWVPFTRAGCDVGAAGGPAGLVLENTTSDLEAVFGRGSKEVAEASADPAAGAAAFLGLAIHCARPSPACSSSLGGRPDRLPDEPGGYDGYNALYGQRYLGPRIAPSGQLTDLEGRPLDRFPGFGAMTPSASLGYAAAMQEHGVPVTFAYLSDPHYSAARGAYGPGEPGYVQQLQDYDRAFALFLDRLKRGGIGPENTLFVVSSGESARFVGAPPRPAGCDGAQTQCGYEQRGAIEVNLPGLLAEQQKVATPPGLQDAAGYALWVKGDPGSVTSVTRTLEKATGRLVVRDPYSGASQPLIRYMADRAELRLLHMVSADPARAPSFVLVANPGYYLAGGPPTCTLEGCLAVDPRRPYNQGAPGLDLGTAWLAVAGPGVARNRLDSQTWIDQADIRPTLLALVGLRDSYAHDGRVVSEALRQEAEPPGIRESRAAYESVAASLEQLNSPAGRVGLLSLAAATRALRSDSTGDGAYRVYLLRIQGFSERRDAAAGQMLTALEAAAFDGKPLDPRAAAAMVNQADQLITEMGRA